MSEDNSNNNITSMISPTDSFKKSPLEYYKSSTPISTKSNNKNKNDSAYSSFVSQQPQLSRTINNPNYDSPGTSYSSRNSGLIDDNEVYELFRGLDCLDTEQEKSCGHSFFIPDNFYRRSTHTSPWTVRPDSAPLNEEEEDSDKEASEYFCSIQVNPTNVTGLPEIVQCTLHSKTRARHASMSDADQRNEMIAMKLQQIADKLPTSAQKKARHRSCILNNQSQSRSSINRHSISSITEMMPNSVGSALDLIVSLYKIYKQHSVTNTNINVSNSQSMHTLNSHQRQNNRNRSYTE